MKRIVAALLLLTAGLAVAQTTPTNPFTVNQFSITATALALPGGKSTLAGTLVGGTFNLTPNLQLRQTDLLTSGTNGYYGGFNYAIPALSKWIDNHTNLAGINFQPYVTASVGVNQVTPTGGTTASHWSVLAGGGFNYAPMGSTTFSLGAEIQYARLPGAAGNTWIIAVGPQLKF